jgi:hypothetical protein
MKLLLVVFLFLGAVAFPCAGQTTVPDAGTARIIAIGINYTGAQVSVDFYHHWSTELRYLLDTSDTDAGPVSSSVIGIRLYRFIHIRKVTRFYYGTELAYATTVQNVGHLKSSGYSGGVFAGIKYAVSPRVFVGADIGPYYTTMGESITSLTASSVDFVFNSFVGFYFW